MITVNNLTPDSACRTFFSNDFYFASFINAILFDGKQVIRPERLVRYENDTSLIVDDTNSVEDKKRRRDMVVKTEVGGIYCLLGIEHQSSIDQEMVIRCGNYEMMEYLKQSKNKRRISQVMVAFYTGDKKWNAPVKLSDYFEIAEELKPYFNDWKIYLVDVKDIDTSKIKDEQTRYFIETIQAMLEGNYDKLHQKIKANRNNFIYAAIITGSLDLIKDLPEGDEIDMCEGMERMAEGFRNEGREQGKLEEKRNSLFNLNELLKIKLGTISSNLEVQLTNASLEKLNVLTRNIFNITNEEDVLRIIH